MAARRSITSYAGRLRTEARRERKEGRPRVSDELAMMATMEKLKRPPVVRPEFRHQEARGREVLRQSQERAMQPDFEYNRDIAPLRQEFFSDLGSSSLTSEEQSMISNQYAPQFSSFDAGQDAFLRLQATQQTQSKKRKANILAPEAAERVKQILSSGSPLAEQQSQLTRAMLDYPQAIDSPQMASIFNSAATSLQAQSRLTNVGNDERLTAARGYASVGIDPATKISGFGSTPLEQSIIEQSRVTRSKFESSSLKERETARVGALTMLLKAINESAIEDGLVGIDKEAANQKAISLALTLQRFVNEDDEIYPKLVATSQGEGTLTLEELRREASRIYSLLTRSNARLETGIDPANKHI